MGRVDAGEALRDLPRLSAEIEGAAIVDSTGAPVAVTAGADGEALARMAAELLEIAAAVDSRQAVERVEIRLSDRSVFAVRGRDHVAVATTRPEPAAALVVHDLRTTLARLGPAAGTTAAKRKRTQDPVDA